MWIWFVMPVCAAISIIMWIVLGKDKKTIPTITTSPPEGLDPLEMDYAQIATISDRGIYAQILYWVSKGYLEVMEKGESVGVRKKQSLPEDAPEHAKYLFQKMFGKTDKVWLDDFPVEVVENKDKLREKVGERFTGKNAVVQDDSMIGTLIAMGILMVGAFVVEVAIDASVLLSALLGVALFIALALLQNGALGFRSKHDFFEIFVGVVGTAGILIIQLILIILHTDGLMFPCVFAVCFLLCIPCIMFMERRVNHWVYGQILGFRQFIETAEWDRLKQLSAEDPDYGMEILPYALLFNMGTQWTEQFEYNVIYNCVEQMEEMSKADE